MLIFVINESLSLRAFDWNSRMVKMKGCAFLFAVLLSSSPLVIAGSICDSDVTSELEACAKNNFEEADKGLSAEYKELSSMLPGPQRKDLIDAQRNWIKYKETYCQAAFDAVSPGAEAGIDKWSCLGEVTRTRTKELEYIRSASDVENFYHAIRFVAKTYENGNREKVIDKLNVMSRGADSGVWNAYVQKNCQLTATRLHEERKVCIARQNFYKDWFQ